MGGAAPAAVTGWQDSKDGLYSALQELLFPWSSQGGRGLQLPRAGQVPLEASQLLHKASGTSVPLAVAPSSSPLPGCGGTATTAPAQG